MNEPYWQTIQVKEQEGEFLEKLCKRMCKVEEIENEDRVQSVYRTDKLRPVLFLFKYNERHK